MSVLIKGGTVVNADERFLADVLCKDGKIVKVAPSIPEEKDVEVVDATGRYVMPGGIDPHTHFELEFMGTVTVDDWYHGSRAALAGGTTMVIDFVIPNKNQSLLTTYDKWVEKAKRSCCDFGFHVAVTWWSKQVEEEMTVCVKERGVNSFKMFMAYKGALMIEDDHLIDVFRHIKSIGGLAQVHAEHGDLVAHGQKYIKELGITGPEGHALSRPSQVEGEATNRAITLARFVNCPLYIVHVSCIEAARFIADARREGHRVFGETVAAYVALDESSYYNKDFDKASVYCISPPIRGKEHQEYIHHLLTNNDLQLVATDNCSHSTAQKAAGKDDFTKIPNGVHGVEDRMSLVFDKMVASGKIGASRYVEITSTMAAKIFNCYPQKGVIREGSDADIIVLNQNRKKTISAKTHFHNLEYNIFEGMEVTGVIETTISRGKVVFQIDKPRADQMTVDPGHGQFVARPPFSQIVYDGIDEKDVAQKPVGVDRSGN